MLKTTVELTKEDFGEKYNPKKHDKYIGEYEFEEWTFGDREDVIEQASEQVKDAKGNLDIIMRSSKFRSLTIQKCMKKAPFKITITEIRKCPPALGEWLYRKCDDLNDEYDLEEIKK